MKLSACTHRLLEKHENVLKSSLIVSREAIPRAGGLVKKNKHQYRKLEKE